MYDYVKPVVVVKRVGYYIFVLQLLSNAVLVECNLTSVLHELSYDMWSREHSPQLLAKMLKEGWRLRERSILSPVGNNVIIFSLSQ